MSAPLYDVVIIGGSNAGLSAALILGRARRSVVVLDSGQPRNASAPRAHGFFTRDGAAPEQLRQLGKAQLEPYGVVFKQAKVTAVSGQNLDFSLSLESGETLSAKKLVLALGVQDDTSILPGLEQLWGEYAYTCPYCHGWEVQDQPLAVIAHGELGYQYASFLLNWSADLSLCTGGEKLEPDHQKSLLGRGVKLIGRGIKQLSKTSEGALIEFDDDSQLACAGIFIRPPTRLNLSLLEPLGIELSDDKTYVLTDAVGQTETQGVYAVGDLASPAAAVILAAASGANAAYYLNHQFVSEQQGATHA